MTDPTRASDAAHTFALTTVGLEPSERLREILATALDKAVTWFGEAGFAISRADVLTHAEIYAEREAFAARLSEVFGVPATDLPDTTHINGTVSGTVLLVVSADLYEASFRELYPQHRWSQAEYAKLITHELAHRAHEVIAMRKTGSSDAMGPQWFFEGLAIVIADQFNSCPPLSSDEFAEAIREPSPGYPRLGQCVRFLLDRHPPRDLLLAAVQPEFPGNLALAAPNCPTSQWSG